MLKLNYLIGMGENPEGESQMPELKKVILFLLVLFILVGCGPRGKIEGIVTKVEYIPSGGILGRPGNTIITFLDGRQKVFLDIYEGTFFIGECNIIYSDNWLKVRRIVRVLKCQN